MSRLRSDAAKVQPEQDAFGFRELADRLGENIRSALAAEQQSSGLVIGLEGAWGSGKSTILNYLRTNLQASLQEGRDFLIDFDPWWLEDDSDLVAALLGAVLDALPQDDRRRVGAVVTRLAAAASRTPESVEALLKLWKKTSFVGDLLGRLRQSGGDLERLLKPTKSIRALRQEVAAAFRSGGYRFVVMVDDLDRLTPEQAIRVMTAIKSVADLPGFVYVLAYDPAALRNILRNFRPPLGADYLEKIVTVSATVPPITTRQTSEFLLGMLEPTLVDAQRAPSARLRHETLVNLLDSPRDAVRLGNAVNFWTGGKLREVYTPDLLLLEAVRLAHPPAYVGLLRTSTIWLEREPLEPIGRLLDASSDDAGRRKAAAEVIRRELQLDDSARHDRVRDALAVMFPQAAQYLGGETPISLGSETAFNPRAIAEPAHFFTYFFHRPLPGAPSRGEIDMLIGAGTPIDQRIGLLAEISRRPEADVSPLVHTLVLLRAELEAEAVPRAAMFELARALRAPPIHIPSPGGIVRVGSTFEEIRQFVRQLLRRHGALSPDQVAILAAPDVGLAWLADLQMFLSRGTPFYRLRPAGDVDRPLHVDLKVVEELTYRTVQAIRDGLQDGATLTSPLAPLLLHLAHTDDAAALEAALAPVLDDPERVVVLTDAFRPIEGALGALANLSGQSPEALHELIERAHGATGREFRPLR